MQMKRIATFFLVLTGVLTSQAEVKHTFICVDNGKNQLVYVDQFEPSNSWKVKIPKGSRDVCLYDDDKVIVSMPSGAIIHNLKDGSVIKEIDGFKGVQSASITSNGNILVAGSNQLAVVSISGEIIKKIEIEEVTKNRLARQLKNGNYLYSINYYTLAEYDQTGKIVWEYTSQEGEKEKDKEKFYLGIEDYDGGIVAATGHSVEIVKITRDGKRSVICGGKKSHPNAGFAWSSGFDILDNKNIVMANWCGHKWKKEKIHLFEFDRDNNIVWQWKDDSVKRVTTVQVIK